MTQAEAMPQDGAAPGLSPQSGQGHLRFGRARAAAAGVAWSLVSVMTATGITVLVFVVTSRLLLPADFGIVALAVGIVMLVSCLVPFGFGEALVQRSEVTDAHLDAVFWLCALSGIIVYGALLVAAPWIAGWLNQPALAPVLALLGVRILLDGFGVVPGALLLRRMNYRAFAIRTGIANGIGGVLCLGLVLAGYGFWALVASQIASTAMNFIVVTALCGWRPRLGFETGRLREIGAFGLAASGTRAIHEMRLDQLLLGAIGGPAALGLYFFARRLSQMVTDLTVGIFSPVTGVLFASMQHEPEKARAAFLMAGFAACLVGLPVFAGLASVAETLVPVALGDQWTGAVFALRAFCAIGVMAVVGIVQATLINSRGHAQWWLGYQGAMQGSAVPVVLVFYPLGGLDAVMAALVARTIVLWPLSVAKTLRLLDLPLRDYLGSVAGPVVASLIMMAAVEAVPLLLPGLEGWPRLAAEIGTGAATYVLLAGVLGRHRIGELVRAARRRKGATE